MIKGIGLALASAAIGAVVAFVLADGLAEGAIMGALLGGSIGAIVAARLLNGGIGAAYEFEAAGLHDGNLITIMRRRLMREAHREQLLADVFDHNTDGM